ncbi:hypothetical protein [Pontibacillus salipaludis]|uniref:DUF3990 domain-containing protein n=1 Tax=Pontibacillus salipaludis TaxID=1697394 RepID=A0ABQ1QE55_9BACI|nr:hypothetical protein [Pontibacillus salipaludis]GGD22924.1 hypothetical protein GCM10011389_33340 [Pontibacillus salipaludis]
MNNTKFIGYHGTIKDKADKIKRTNFTVNFKHVGWLGTGVYFFDEDYDLALDYAKRVHKGRITKVLRGELDVPPGEVFDCTDDNYKKAFHKYREKLQKDLIEKHNVNLKVGNSNDFDGKVYNFIYRKKGYTLFRAETYTFSEVDDNYGFPPSRVPNGIELCLKQPRYIIKKDIV